MRSTNRYSCQQPRKSPSSRVHKLAAAIALIFASASDAGVSPIQGMAQYNATNWGTPKTGTKWDSTKGNMLFTVLYRDNYKLQSGCAGEGCGKHPGVDIAVPSGTPARAVLSGKVIRSECNPSWGGIMVLEADNPYGSGKVYPSYAHLRSRLFSVGQKFTIHSHRDVIDFSLL